MNIELTANIVGIILGCTLIMTAKYWLPIDKLSGVLTLAVAAIFLYGCAHLASSLTTWWLK